MRVFPGVLAVIAMLAKGVSAEPVKTDAHFGFSAIDRQIEARAAMSPAERLAHDTHARAAAETGIRELASARTAGRAVDLDRLTAVQVHALCISEGTDAICEESLRRADASRAAASPALAAIRAFSG